MLTPLLRCLGNLCSDTDEACSRACANLDLIPTLGMLLKAEHRHIRKESMWVLCNITGITEVSLNSFTLTALFLFEMDNGHSNGHFGVKIFECRQKMG